MAKKTYSRETEFSAYAPARNGYDITPSATDQVESKHTRAVMVSAAATITGIFTGGTTSHTTFELQPGILYPFAFRRISAVSNGASVKGYN